MTHVEMMNVVWQFIQDVGITEDKDAYEKDDQLYLVENIYQVRDAYYSDLENDTHISEEDVSGFLDRHGIEWK